MPGNLGWGSLVFAAMTIFAPSLAALLAIANPIPLLAPEIKSVLPDKFSMHCSYLLNYESPPSVSFFGSNKASSSALERSVSRSATSRTGNPSWYAFFAISAALR